MTKRFKLINKDKQLVGIQVETDKDLFTIPVVDVRRNEDQRRKAEGMIKVTNSQRGSKYIKPSFSLMGFSYNVSHKK